MHACLEASQRGSISVDIPTCHTLPTIFDDKVYGYFHGYSGAGNVSPQCSLRTKQSSTPLDLSGVYRVTEDTEDPHAVIERLSGA